MEYFKTKWSYFDPNATALIKITDFPKFMIELGEPLGWSKEVAENQEM